MTKKIVVLIFTLIISIIIYTQFKEKKISEDIVTIDEESYNSNLLEDIKYVAKDSDGNEYVVNAKEGEIDLANKDIIYLKKVVSFIKLKNSDKINITSDFGKYNSSNYDTIFSKNVVITFLDNKIIGEYLDFSLEQNKIIISKNVIFSNLENVMKADVIEINIKTKDTKIFMYEENKKVNIKSKNYKNGNN